jgi:RecA-family ATPase
MTTHQYSIEEEAYIEGRRRQVQLDAEAKRRAAQDEIRLELPDFRVLTEVPVRQKYKVEELMPSDSYVLLSAQKKSGKTTTVINLVRSLVTGEPFLGEFHVHGKARVALVDFEMGEGMLSEWLKDAGLLRNDNLYVMTLRGQAKAFDVLDDIRLDELSVKLSDLGVDVLFTDPLGPLMRAYGIDENSVDVGTVVDRLLGLKEAAGISNLVGVHHNGKNDDLGARGSSVGKTPRMPSGTSSATRRSA